jgi:hypothetical protein
MPDWAVGHVGHVVEIADYLIYQQKLKYQLSTN